MKFLVTDEQGTRSIINGEKFTITSENHLVISTDDKPVALFAAGRWNSVQEHNG